MIKAENISKAYANGRTQALKDVSLEIADGASVAILGASGSGKTTLMNILSGLEKADDGDVVVDGQSLSAKTEKELTAFRRDNVGFVFQQYYLLPHLSVDGNVKMGASLVGNADYREIIAELGLGDRLKAMPCELSGGEQQRVCIARALAKKPKYLFCDEPTGALDEATGRDVLDIISRQKDKLGFTLITVTHNRNIAETAETVVTLNSGKIVKTERNAAPKTAYEIGW